MGIKDVQGINRDSLKAILSKQYTTVDQFVDVFVNLLDFSTEEKQYLKESYKSEMPVQELADRLLNHSKFVANDFFKRLIFVGLILITCLIAGLLSYKLYNKIIRKRTRKEERKLE